MKIWKQNYFSKGHSICKKYWQKNALGSLETLVLKPTALHSWHDYCIFLNCTDEMSWDSFAKEIELGSVDLLLILSVLLTMHSLLLIPSLSFFCNWIERNQVTWLVVCRRWFLWAHVSRHWYFPVFCLLRESPPKLKYLIIIMLWDKICRER